MIVVPASALQQQQPGATPFGGIPPQVIVAMNFTEWWLRSQVALDQIGLIDDPPRGLPPAACKAFLASCEAIEQYVGGRKTC